jgi:hypothetical protein
MISSISAAASCATASMSAGANNFFFPTGMYVGRPHQRRRR